MDESLDNILGIASDATTAAVKQNPIQAAAEILNAELVTTADGLNQYGETGPTDLGPSVPKVGTPEIAPDPHEVELGEDMQFARSNIKDLIDQGRVAMQGALELAEAGDQPRAYEVVATMLTAVVQASKELITLHKTRKETLKTDKETKHVGEATPGDVHIKQAVFVGRAQDLLRSLKDIEKEAAKELNGDA